LDIIEEIYPEAEARLQGARCLRCNVNTVFDTSICIACNGCVDVCPEAIIKLVGLSRLVEDEEWQRQASMFFQKPVDELKAMDAAQLDSMGAVMMKDETTCIRCSACAARCPTLAVTMQTFQFHRECVSVPTRNSKLKYGDSKG